MKIKHKQNVQFGKELLPNDSITRVYCSVSNASTAETNGFTNVFF